MNAGRTVFSQLMDYLPTYEFQKCVNRYSGDYRSRSLSCRDQFLAMAFAQLTYRVFATSRLVCDRSVASSTTWVSGARSFVPLWPMPTNPATGGSMQTLHRL